LILPLKSYALVVLDDYIPLTDEIEKHAYKTT